MNIQEVRNTVQTILDNRKLPRPRYWVYAPGNDPWMFGVMDKHQFTRLKLLMDNDLLHTLSAAVGYPVTYSNSNGFRIAVALGGRPRLPEQVAFPEDALPQDTFYLGMGLKGAVTTRVGIDRGEFLHMIVAGTTGSGKSNFLELMTLTALAHRWKLYLVDPEGHTWNPDTWGRLAAFPVATSVEELLQITSLIRSELARRAALYQEVARENGGLSPEDLDDYNKLAIQFSVAPLQRIGLFIEEANSLLGGENSPEVTDLAQIAQRGRKWGIHLLLAAQSWRSKDVPRKLSGMLGARVCFQVDDDTSGKVALNNDEYGKKAQHLQPVGRAIVRLRGMGFQYVQTPAIPKERKRAILSGAGPLPSMLKDWERDLMRFAIEQHRGKFAIGIITPYAQEHWARGQYSVEKLAKEWEARGWLSRPRLATESRYVTREGASAGGFTDWPGPPDDDPEKTQPLR